MPRSRLRDYLERRDMRRNRNPYGSRGGYVRDRAYMDYADMRNDRADMRRGDRADMRRDYADRRSDYGDMRRNDYGDMRSDYDMRQAGMDYGRTTYDDPNRQYDSRRDYEMRDRHYEPVEAMGYFKGYYGGGEDYNSVRNDRAYDKDYAGDFGESLSKEELEKWQKKLEKEVDDDQAKHFFKKENIEQKAKQMAIEMKNFKPEELAVASLMMYTDYCKDLKPYVGNNMEIYIKLGKSFLTDPDSEVKGGEKLALYQDLVSGSNE